MKIKKENDITKNRFQEIHNLKAQYKGKYPLIDMGIGEDKTMPDHKIISKLTESLKLVETHKYADNGLDLLKSEAVRYLKEHFYINKNVSNIALTMGTKQALSILVFLLCKRKDTIITTKPGYVVFSNVSRLLDVNIYELSLKEENDFLPDLESIPKWILKKTKVFQINYPNNPTGAVATKEFYKKLIELAKKYDFYIINDAAYLDFSFKKPLSIFSLESDYHKLIELFTLSKSHNMTGYRIGFLLAHEVIARKYERFKDNFDSGQFLGIQYAAIEALSNYSISRNLRIKYHNRANRIYSIFKKYHFQLRKPEGTFFLYVKTFDNISSFEMASSLLNNFGIVAIPYNDAGEYLRFSLTYETDDEEKFYEEFEKRISLFIKEKS
ncbi:MAG: aminotransferase class I/II-fold pyridoxal phosphate-dependent enzyme [Bacilli bacterium]